MLLRALLTGVIGWIVFSFAASFSNPNLSFGQMLGSLPAIAFGIVAFVGSFIGFVRLSKK